MTNSFTFQICVSRCIRTPLSSILALCILSLCGAQENWPQFRGPGANGVASDNAGLPTTWSTTDNVKWIADIPGWGWSCPIVWGNRVFLTTVVADEENLSPSAGLYLGEGVREPSKGTHHWLVYCFDLKTGKQLWKQEAHAGRAVVPRHPKSTYGTETAATDGQRVYVLFGDLGLYCYDLDGTPLWSRSIEPKKTFMDYGAAASPVVHDGQVFVVYDNQEASWIASFDAETGDENWRQLRDETHSWATPFVWVNQLRTELVVPGKKRNRSYSLEGELLWEFDGQMSNLVIPSPFAAHGLCYIASGYVGDAHRPTFAIKPGASGDFTPESDFADSEFIEWYQATASSYNPTQIVYGDYLYTLYDQGFLTCHNARTGEQIYGKKRFSPGGSFTASPFAYNGHIFCLSEDGLTYAIKAGPEYEIVARNKLDEMAAACPAVIDDKLLIRTASKLYCITEGAELDPSVAATMLPRRSATKPIDFWRSVRQGDISGIKKSLAAGQDVNAKQRGSRSTALNITAVYRHTEAMELLLETGADVSIANPDGNTALHIASFFGHIDQVKLLLARGASAKAKNKQGNTPISSASGPITPQLEEFYNGVGRAIGKELDLEWIAEVRPLILKTLQESIDKFDDASQYDFSSVKRLMTYAIESGKVAGAAHIVSHRGKEIYFESAGVRDIEDQEPFERDSILRFYSMTKAITSVAAMTLFEQGKFELDDPIAKFIPAFEKTTVMQKEGDDFKVVPANRQITVRDVFCHMTGYSYGGNGIPELEAIYRKEGMKYREPSGMMPPEMTIEQAAETLARIPALHHPGRRFTYGYSTDLLGRLIEIWSKKSLDVYLQESVLEPLQMDDTAFVVAESKIDRFASCHTTRGGKLAIIDKGTTSRFAKGFQFLSGGGGLTSTIEDYSHFCAMMVDKGKFEGKRILKPETVDLMLTDQIHDPTGNFKFGLGFAIKGVTLGSGDSQRQATQYSWGGYASTDFRLVPDEKLYQIFVRQHVPSRHGLGGKAFLMVYSLLK